VSCDHVGIALHGYFDKELDAISASEFERHLERCSDCVNALEALESLRSSINVARLYEKAPATFRKKILAHIGSAPPVAVFPIRSVWRLLAVAAALILVAYTGWRVVFPSSRSGNYESVFTSEILDAHLRSLQPGHLTDVVSTDQHTVKPWFDGKLDFSPPVQDFGNQGFSLQGGRIDVVHGRTVAALVYARRKHLVNVFIWPTDEKDAAPRSSSQRGYQWIEWRKGGMEFCAVSDAVPSALEELQRLFAE
jgi:anti-sigma factor RsiW